MLGIGPIPDQALNVLQEILDWANRIDSHGIDEIDDDTVINRPAEPRSAEEPVASETREEEFKADLDKIIEEAVSHYCNKFKERYPEDVFPPDGNSLDCKSARMARLTCDNIIEEAKKEEEQ